MAWDKVFLLSPANMSGLRARQLTSPRAKFETARMYQSADGVPIALAFAFMSALYFRGKIAYALQFAETENIFVIAPGFGLVPPDWRITEERMKILSKTEILHGSSTANFSASPIPTATRGLKTGPATPRRALGPTANHGK